MRKVPECYSGIEDTSLRWCSDTIEKREGFPATRSFGCSARMGSCSDDGVCHTRSADDSVRARLLPADEDVLRGDGYAILARMLPQGSTGEPYRCGPCKGHGRPT